MIVIFKIYNWQSRKQIETQTRVEKGKVYVVQNNFGQYLGEVEQILDDKLNKKSDLEISGSDEVENKTCTEEYIKVVRVANFTDREKQTANIEKEKEALKICREKVKEYELPMKLVGANYSLDGSSLIIAFIAENRVDFRILVRDLSRTLQKSVRLEQIGSRDEARCHGGCGPCGRNLCCFSFCGNLKSINTEMARLQQIAHRGSERISGCCGRLMCCLAYEIENYEENVEQMPQIGQEVRTKDNKKGIACSLKILQKEVLVKFGEDDKAEEKWLPVNQIRFKKLQENKKNQENGE